MVTVRGSSELPARPTAHTSLVEMASIALRALYRGVPSVRNIGRVFLGPNAAVPVQRHVMPYRWRLTRGVARCPHIVPRYGGNAKQTINAHAGRPVGHGHLGPRVPIPVYREVQLCCSCPSHPWPEISLEETASTANRVLKSTSGLGLATSVQEEPFQCMVRDRKVLACS